jgi:hypothetical protein
MPQQQQQPELKPTYVPPITCICGGTAHLIRSAPHPLKLGGRIEIRTFQCYECRRLTETTVKP